MKFCYRCRQNKDDSEFGKRKMCLKCLIWDREKRELSRRERETPKVKSRDTMTYEDHVRKAQAKGTMSKDYADYNIRINRLQKANKYIFKQI